MADISLTLRTTRSNRRSNPLCFDLNLKNGKGLTRIEVFVEEGFKGMCTCTVCVRLCVCVHMSESEREIRDQRLKEMSNESRNGDVFIKVLSVEGCESVSLSAII